MIPWKLTERRSRFIPLCPRSAGGMREKRRASSCPLKCSMLSEPSHVTFAPRSQRSACWQSSISWEKAYPSTPSASSNFWYRWKRSCSTTLRVVKSLDPKRARSVATLPCATLCQSITTMPGSCGRGRKRILSSWRSPWTIVVGGSFSHSRTAS
jgi:hypothetical protein